MVQYLLHIAKAGQRWDHLAHHYYGDAKMIKPIMQANRFQYFFKNKPTPKVFKGGEELRIPVIEHSILDTNKLPPWKR